MATVKKKSNSSSKNSASSKSTSTNDYPALVPLDAGKSSSAHPFVSQIIPEKTSDDVILSPQNKVIFSKLLEEFRKGDRLRRHGLKVSSRLLFCGPPGCGKTATAEAFANEIGLDLLVVRLDAVISSFLGETASNIKSLIESAERRPCVLFFDEFDALAHSRSDPMEHSEIRRVVNSLLMLIENFQGRGFIIAATNLQNTLDEAIWRRFDEAIYFEKPTIGRIREVLTLKTRNFPANFSIEDRAEELKSFSYAEIEAIILAATKRAIMDNRKRIKDTDFDNALKEMRRRIKVRNQITSN